MIFGVNCLCIYKKAK